MKLCVTSRNSKCGIFAHGRSITSVLGTNLRLRPVLIFIYLKLLDVETDRKVFDQMPERTYIISGYGKTENNAEAVFI